MQEKMNAGDQVLFVEGLKGLPAHQLEYWTLLMPTFRQKAAAHYRFAEDKTRSLVGFSLLCTALGYIPSAFLYSEHKKPFLPKGPHFNISHSEDCAAVAVASTAVGIDAESLRAAPMEVSHRVFTKAERDWIMHAENRDQAFFHLWTRKESYIKMTGDGLYVPLQELEVIPDKAPLCGHEEVSIQSYSTQDSEIAICRHDDAKLAPLTFSRMTLAELIEAFARLAKE
jgi:4'-phosphopantetheinyl transferase